MPRRRVHDDRASASSTIGGYMPTPEGAPTQAHWLSHLQVADAKATRGEGHVARRQGRARSPIKIGDFGTMAIVADPLGGAFALWQPAKAEGTGDFKGQPSTWCWNELVHAGRRRSRSRSTRAIGGFDRRRRWTWPSMGTYHVLKRDGKPRAGVMKPPMPEQPQAWMPYVQVASADQTRREGEEARRDDHRAADRHPERRSVRDPRRPAGRARSACCSRART